MYREVLRVTRILRLGYFCTGFVACIFFAWGMWAIDFGALGMAICYGGVSWTTLNTYNEMKRGLNEKQRT